MPSYLVTGSSRGIGLGLVAELLKDEKNIVIATARSTAASPGLQQAGKTCTNIDEFMTEMQFNLTSPIYLLREFLPLIRKSEAKKVLIMTSSLGSTELAGHMKGLANTYSVAKASLNMLIRKWSTTLKDDGITTFLLHPGWVGVTELGSKITNWMETYAPQVTSLTVEDSAAGCIKVLNGVGPEDNGLCFSYDGTKIPW
ncbi:hypothetical protein QQX98_003130 [Neonectria punicea]|uniref:Uncharacterized protein n=1 Tax=Neonectria punicea TaxID=979145 RepID=A0ABR1HEY4_9HYPO